MTRDGTVAPRVADSADIADPPPSEATRTVLAGAPPRARRRLSPAALGRSESGKAAALAAAAANNAIQLVIALVFMRLLRASGYGTPTALISAFLLPMVAGQSILAVAEPVLLSASDAGVVAFAAVVLGVQCAAAAGVLALGLRARTVRLPVAAAR
jgi:hypothetical protein